MKKREYVKNKILSLVLAATMVVTSLPMTVFAMEDSILNASGLTQCHQEHDENCGYIQGVEGALCQHECELCKTNDTQQNDTTEVAEKEDTDLEDTDPKGAEQDLAQQEQAANMLTAPISSGSDYVVGSGTMSEVYVAPMSLGTGAENSPTSWKNALAKVSPGGTIYIMQRSVYIKEDMTIYGAGISVKPYYNSSNSLDPNNLTDIGATSLFIMQQSSGGVAPTVEMSNMIFDGGGRPDDYYGDFISIEYGALTFHDCVIQNYTNTSYGAAINAYSGTTLTLNNTEVINNRTGLLIGGGGVRGGVHAGGTVNINGTSNLSNNVLYAQYSSRDVVEDIYISNNGVLNLSGTAKVGVIAFGDSKDADDVVNITSALQNDISIHKHTFLNFNGGMAGETFSIGDLMAAGTDGYVLTDDDIKHIKVIAGRNKEHAFKNADNQAFYCMDFRILTYPSLPNGTLANGKLEFSATPEEGMYMVAKPTSPNLGLMEPYSHFGTVIKVAPKADAGYHYVEGSMQTWDYNNADIADKVSLTQVPGKNQWTFEVPLGLFNNIVEVSCEFAENPYSLIVQNGTDGTDGTMKYAAGDKVTITAVGKENKKFTGWKIISGTPAIKEIKSAITELTMPANNVEIAAMYVDEPTYKVDGSITGNADEPPTAVLVRNGVKYPATVENTGTQTHYYYNYVPAGQYNLVVTAKIGGEIVTITALVSVENSNVTQNVTLPGGSYNSKVTSVGTDTPNIEGGGLDDIAGKLGEDPTNADVLIELKVEKNDSSTNATDVSKSISDDKMKKGIMMDLDLWKTVNSASSEKIEELAVADHGTNLITVILHLPSDLQNKDGYALYRYHNYSIGGKVDKVTETPNALGEYIKVNSAKTSITAYLGRFSTYAVAYTEKEKPSGGGSSGGGGIESDKHILTFDTNGGDKIASKRYNNNTTASLNEVPTKKGYIFVGWYANKELTEKITNIKMTKSLTVYAKWDRSEVPELLDGGKHDAYIVGFGDGTVRPKNNITRGESAAIFYRLLKEEVRTANTTDISNITDCRQGNWYNTSVATLAKLGIIHDSGAFRPADKITRAEFAEMAARFDTTPYSGPDYFTDISGHWAREQINRAAANGWIMGDENGVFRPEDPISRAEVMMIVNKVLNRTPKKPDAMLPSMKTWSDNADKSTWYYIAVQEATNSHNYNIDENGLESWVSLY